MQDSLTQLLQNVASLGRSYKGWVFRLLDVLLITLSYYFAIFLRFDLAAVPEISSAFLTFLSVSITIKLVIFNLLGVYKQLLRYAGMELVKVLMLGVFISSLCLGVIFFYILEQNLPRSILILDGLISLILILGARFLLVQIWSAFLYPQDPSNSLFERVLIYGAGVAGSQLSLGLSRSKNFKIFGFLDDQAQLKGHKIGEYRIYSPSKLALLVDQYQINTILLAMPSASQEELEAVLKKLEPFDLKIKTIPSVGEIVSGKVTLNQLHEVDIIDLLGRQEVPPLKHLLKDKICDQVVMVTGAGGSIGSELCRQIATQQPKLLILLDQNELALYQVTKSLEDFAREGRLKPVLGSILDRVLIDRLIKSEQVNTIYHAAAYKHVPIVEENYEEGLKNNLGGTLTLVQSAFEHQVPNFTLISTDKAVRPTNIMGASKRASELILQAYHGKQGNQTQFSMVRFGNVLDSSGSVVPLFREQIRKKQNLTVTDREVTRYFMSIPEAARLVIQAGVMAEGGDVFVLDMGKPVKIYDLAEQMIRLSGLVLGQDIEIEVVGMRPGEKLHEELVIDPEKLRETIHPKIFKTHEHHLDWEVLEPLLNELFVAAKTDRLTTIAAIKKVVREYTGPPKHDQTP